LAALFYYLGNEAYRDWKWGVLTPEEREQKKKEVMIFDASTIACLGVSGACLVVSSVFWLSTPPTRRYRVELDSVEEEISVLENTLR
jgi:hypothetical protein